MRRRFNKEHRAWRQAIIKRDKGCVICGKTNYLNAHHLIPSNFKEYALDPENGLALCPKHHTLGSYSAHKHPIWFSNWLRIHYNYLYFKILDKMERVKDEYQV